MENFESNNIIEIWSEDRGRKTNTYIHGWDIDEMGLKDHLKIIKKKKGCNGSIKELVKETGKIKVLHFQGNQKDYVFEYLKQNGIMESKLRIKI